MPRRLATPGRKPSMTMSARFTSFSTRSAESFLFRSTARLRLLRFSVLNCTGTYARPGSPRGGSTLITSAPRSAKIAVANGPGTNIEKSTTRTPRSGSQGSAAMLFEIRRRVDDQDPGALAGDDQQMHRVGGKEAGLARLHLELLAADLDVRVAFEQVAHLLDSLVRVRQRALAALDLAHQRSEEHTSELQSLAYIVCRLLLEKKKATPSSTSGPQPTPRRSLTSLGSRVFSERITSPLIRTATSTPAHTRSKSSCAAKPLPVRR